LAAAAAGKVARMSVSSTVVWCSRCNRPAPINEAALAGDGGGDPSLLPVLIPPGGWLPDPDDEDRIICRPCATEAELDEDDERLDEADEVILDEVVAHVIEEEGGAPDGPDD